MNTYDITSISDLESFVGRMVESFVPIESQATLITLSGDLGAGKTTLTQKLGSVFGIAEDEINSPTYVIEQRYPISNHPYFNELVHIDAYRLEQKDDPYKIGLDQTLRDPSKLVVIEWPQKIESFLDEYKEVSLELTYNSEKREVVVLEK